MSAICLIPNTSTPENKYYDKKSAGIKPSDLANLISAFANAEGGTIAIGISDKENIIEGINKIGEKKINDLINAPKDFCKPMPAHITELRNVVNCDDEPDRILYIFVEASPDQVIRTNNDSTYLRIGDRTRELKGEDLKNLEYIKNSRHYEEEFSIDAKIDDLDDGLLNIYKEKIEAQDLSNEQVLRARGFLKDINGSERLTNGAILLFAKNILQFNQNCRIRLIKYDGNFEKSGVKMNIIKDISIDLPILKILDKSVEVISAQLRDFTSLNPDTGLFQTVPEYPEFAWVEGITNAVAHRDYSMSGAYIKVSMFDDRLEILSPGKLPNLVTIDNIKDTRYSRNIAISRVLTEFGWVRELNEGVKRIYSDMKEYFLEEPVYSEPDGHVKLVLKNNIVVRRMRQHDRYEEEFSEDVWDSLDALEKAILTYMGSNTKVTRGALEKYTKKSQGTISARLNNLIKLGLIKRSGKKFDPTQVYELNRN